MVEDYNSAERSIRILIIGGSGYIGQFLFHHLRGKKSGNLAYEVSYTSTEKNNYHQIYTLSHYYLNFSDEQSVLNCIKISNPMIIINCAAISSPKLCEETPDRAYEINQPKALITAIMAQDCVPYLIHFSTDLVYDGNVTPDQGYSEEDIGNPCNQYGMSKLAFDHMLDNLLDNYTILRISNVLGPPPPVSSNSSCTGKKFFQWIYDELIQGNSVNLWEDEIRSFTYIMDILNAVEKLISSIVEKSATPSKLYHLGSPKGHSRVDIGNLILKGIKKTRINSAKIIPSIRSSLSLSYESPMNVTLQSSLIERELNMSITSVPRMVEEILKYTHQRNNELFNNC